MRKILTLLHISAGAYKKIENNNDLLATLYFFMTDGCSIEFYIDFLKDPSRQKFMGNINNLIKHNDMVTITVDEIVIPDLPPMTLKNDQLITFLLQWIILRKNPTKEIIIVWENNLLRIS